MSSATLGCIHDCLCCVQDTATRCQLSGRYQCLGCCHFLYNQPNLPRTTKPLQQHWGPRYVVSPSPFWKLPFLPCLHHFRSERQSHCLSAFCSGFRSFNPLERRGLKMIFYDDDDILMIYNLLSSLLWPKNSWENLNWSRYLGNILMKSSDGLCFSLVSRNVSWEWILCSWWSWSLAVCLCWWLPWLQVYAPGEELGLLISDKRNA